jgi:hypothetical protein
VSPTPSSQDINTPTQVNPQATKPGTSATPHAAPKRAYSLTQLTVDDPSQLPPEIDSGRKEVSVFFVVIVTCVK